MTSPSAARRLMRYPLGRLLALALVSAAAAASQPLTATVDFSPAAQAKLERYGREEGATLQERILKGVKDACDGTTLPPGTTVAVTVQDIAPTYPTREQQKADPGMDPVGTRYLGGAELTGQLRDAGGKVLTSVTTRYFPPSIRWRSRSFEPWADANRAIGQFADRMGSACRRLGEHETRAASAAANPTR